jgi:hypothetical protein
VVCFSKRASNYKRLKSDWKEEENKKKKKKKKKKKRESRASLFTINLKGILLHKERIAQLSNSENQENASINEKVIME